MDAVILKCFAEFNPLLAQFTVFLGVGSEEADYLQANFFLQFQSKVKTNLLKFV